MPLAAADRAVAWRDFGPRHLAAPTKRSALAHGYDILLIVQFDRERIANRLAVKISKSRVYGVRRKPTLDFARMRRTELTEESAGFCCSSSEPNASTRGRAAGITASRNSPTASIADCIGGPDQPLERCRGPAQPMEEWPDLVRSGRQSAGLVRSAVCQVPAQVPASQQKARVATSPHAAAAAPKCFVSARATKKRMF